MIQHEKPCVRCAARQRRVLPSLIGAAGLVLLALQPLPVRCEDNAEPAQAVPAPSAETEVERALRLECYDLILKLMQDFPNQPIPLGLMALYHFQFTNADNAIAWWQQAVEVDPRFAQGYFRMADIAFKSGDFERAIEQCRKALEINPKYLAAYEKLGLALLSLGRPEEAVLPLSTGFKIDPRAYYFESHLGEAYLQLKDYEQAVRHLEVAFEKRPRDKTPAYGLTKAYARLRQREKAAEYQRAFNQRHTVWQDMIVKIRREWSDDYWASQIAAKIHTAAGQQYEKQGDTERMEKHWRRAALLDKNHLRSRELLAEHHMRRQEWPEAVECYDQLLELVPEHSSHLFNKGVALAYLRRLDEAEGVLRQALRLEPEHVPGYHSLLQVLIHENRKLPEAKTVAEQLVTLAPTLDNYLLLGGLCRDTRDREGALAAMKRAAELAPGNKDINRIYQSLKKGP